MKKRLLALVLAIILVISLLPATTSAAAVRYRLTFLYGTDYALQVWASTEGEVTYTKNKEVTLTDSSGNEFTGWAQEIVEVTNEETDEWNTKFYCTASKQTVLILKGAKLDSYNNEANAIVSSSYAIYGLSAYNTHNLSIVVKEDSTLESGTIIMANGSGTKIGTLSVTSENNAKLTCNSRGYFAYSQGDFIKLNANIDFNGNGNSFLFINKSGAYYQIDGGNYNVSAYRLTAHSSSSYTMYIQLPTVMAITLLFLLTVCVTPQRAAAELPWI